MTITELKSKLSKTLEHLQQEMSQIRTGRASPTLLENILVEAYGTKMTLKELGSISVIDAQNLGVQIWDKSLQGDIVGAIRDSDLKVNPVIDGSIIRVPIPALTEDRRKEFVKIVSGKVEETKNAMRNIRQEAMKDIERGFTDKVFGEDEKFSQKETVEQAVKDFVSQVDELGEDKKADILRL
ncbi:MAG TPA: ribosome recycling factor [Patescibacteria group bacterium]|nr:ribosome recycling factor [Patescibacteria group bacterium]